MCQQLKPLQEYQGRVAHGRSVLRYIIYIKGGAAQLLGRETYVRSLVATPLDNPPAILNTGIECFLTTPACV